MHNNIVTIYGAKTLDKYTEGILIKGFENNNWHATKSGAQNSNTETCAVIYQIHGAEPATEEDNAIMEIIGNSSRYKAKQAILLHRPDEIQLRYPSLGNIFKLNSAVGLVFLGDKHLKDAFYASAKKKTIIPHGFFDLSEKFQEDPVVIGSHTTWGEMRSIEHALKLLGEIFVLNSKQNKKIIGYLGGTPSTLLQMDYLKSIMLKIHPSLNMRFLDAHQFKLSSTAKYKSEHLIIVDSKNIKPQELELTFNVQMYYINNGIRTGESSGSAHSSTGIPVILEMNGAENIEKLEVIKIPYTDIKDIESVDFQKGARIIMNCINNENFKVMMKKNFIRSKEFNNTYIAKQYINFFQTP